jgi:hypothetical protein
MNIIKQCKSNLIQIITAINATLYTIQIEAVSIYGKFNSTIREE